MTENKDIFISHSGKDKQIVDNFIDLILHGALSVPINNIFCTSTDGTKILLFHLTIKRVKFV